MPVSSSANLLLPTEPDDVFREIFGDSPAEIERDGSNPISGELGGHVVIMSRFALLAGYF